MSTVLSRIVSKTNVYDQKTTNHNRQDLDVTSLEAQSGRLQVLAPELNITPPIRIGHFDCAEA